MMNLSVLVLSVAASCRAMGATSMTREWDQVASDSVAATLHDNWVYFANSDAVQFTELGHSITDGQHYAGTHTNGMAVDVVAGRKGSPKPAAVFKSGITALQMLGLNADAIAPKELNFVTYGTMTFTIGGKRFTCPDFRLAQGHNTGQNNWWIGSSDCASVPKGSQLSCCCGAKLCKGGQGNYAISITPGSTGDHVFYVIDASESSQPLVPGVAEQGMLPQDTVAATPHDNWVYFADSDAVYFTELGHSITAEQPYAGARSSSSSVDVVAGRKGSPKPAAVFKSGITALQMLGLETDVAAPKELNFVTYGTMTFTIGGRNHICRDFRLAQGHNSKSQNNWWIGSSDCASVPKGSQLTCCCGAKMCDGGHGNYAISITPGSGTNEFYVEYSSYSFPPLPPPPASVKKPLHPWSKADDRSCGQLMTACNFDSDCCSGACRKNLSVWSCA